jgi:RNA polymerase sigma factor (sigma-70 family)
LTTILSPSSPTGDKWGERMKAVAECRDKHAFAEIFDYFTPRLEAYLQRLGLSAGEAEDIAQDVMTTLWVKSALFDPGKSSVSTWIYRIARNRRIDRARRTREQISLDDIAPALEPVDERRPDSALEGDQNAKALRAAMIELPEEQRQLIQLSYFEGMSQSEIATRAALPLGTVKSRLRLAFNRLRVALSARGISSVN